MAQDLRTNLQDSDTSTGDDEIGIVSALIVLAKHKRLVFGLPLVVAVLTAIITVLMPNVYTATARILPPQPRTSSAAALLDQLGGALGGLAGPALETKHPSDLYIGMLRSRTVADNLISRFTLKKLFETPTEVDTRKALADVTNIYTEKGGIIDIAVDDRDPKRAAAIANTYIEELNTLNDSLAITNSAQRRLFLGRQLANAKEKLASAEINLKKTQEKTGVIQLSAQGKVIIEAVARLRAEIAAKEVQIGAMKSFAAERNPELTRAQRELAGLLKQLKKLERDHSNSEGDVLVPAGRVPEAALEYIRKARDVKYYETLYQLLAKQYEIARLDEANAPSLIQVLDKAVPPDKRSKPKRVLIVLIASLMAEFFAVPWAFLIEAMRRARQDPRQAERLNLLFKYLGRKRA